jgi:hypothetical protein
VDPFGLSPCEPEPEDLSDDDGWDRLLDFDLERGLNKALADLSLLQEAATLGGALALERFNLGTPLSRTIALNSLDNLQSGIFGNKTLKYQVGELITGRPEGGLIADFILDTLAGKSKSKSQPVFNIDAGKKIHKSQSPVWQNLKPSKGKTKTDGSKYYEWDHTHGDVEVFDKRGNHMGSMDPITGNMTKPPVPGRKIRL